MEAGEWQDKEAGTVKGVSHHSIQFCPDSVYVKFLCNAAEAKLSSVCLESVVMEQGDVRLGLLHFPSID